MKIFIHVTFVCLLLFTINQLVAAPDPDNEIKKYTISGYIRDHSSGELLIGVTVYCPELKLGTVTNVYGFYSISLTPGDVRVQYSYVGYKTQSQTVQLIKNVTLDVNLEMTGTELGEVVVTGKRTDENVRAPEMSLVKLDTKTIARVPALLGEIDLIKVIQLLPGVQATAEGATGFSVRGGNSDQNLIILDEATIQNASHLMGFFSVFNNDAIKDVTLYKGDIPSAYGGRLSSLLDVRMKDGNVKQFKLAGSVGTISSKLTLEGPVVSGRSTYLVAARRTYADLFLPFANDKQVRKSKLYFYDLNAKINYVIDDNNRLYLSGYAGRDTFKNQFASMGFGNQTASLRWNHLFSKKLFFNLSLIYSRYQYNLGTPEGDANSFEWTSKMLEKSARFDFTYYISSKHNLRFGATTMMHDFFPGNAKGTGTESGYTEFILPTQHALDHSLYAGDEFKINNKITLKYGLRFAAFQNIGSGTYYRFDAQHNPIDSVVYAKNDIFHTYSAVEPRLAFTYLIDEKSSVKGSYSFTKQFITLAQNSTAGTPLDIWFPATPNVKPQSCNQAALGYFRNFKSNMFEASLEVYYKKFDHVIDFCDHAELLLNEYIEGELRIGKGNSYGVETLLRKNEGKLTGWISYTYSRAFREISEINNGNRYPAPFDKPHTFNLIVNYVFSERVDASLTWIYATGVPVTFPTGRAYFGNAPLPIYSDRNAYRMPDYHRLDLSVTLKGKENPNKRWKGEWNLSIYNAYNRHNAWSINFTQDTDNQYITYAEKTYLFAVIPAITYNFKFQ